MTKKDYILIADDIVSVTNGLNVLYARNYDERQIATKAIDTLVETLASTFQKDNSKFDYERFTNYIYTRITG